MRYLWSIFILVLLAVPVWAEDEDDDFDINDREERLEEQMEDRLDALEEMEDFLEEQQEQMEEELEERLEAAFEDDDGDDEIEEQLERQLERNMSEKAIAGQLDELEGELEAAFDDIEPDHFIALLDTNEWQALKAQGVVAAAVEPLSSLGLQLVTLTALPSNAQLTPASIADSAIAPDHYYQLDSVDTSNTTPDESIKMGQSAPVALGWSHAKPALRRIGLMDSGIDAKHPCMRGVSIHQRVFHSPANKATKQPNDTAHGTAMASLIAGAADCEASGILSSAELVNAVVFDRSPQGVVVASAGQLIQGLDWLLQQQVEIINMSLSGPANPLLERVLQQVRARGVQLLASVGNDGAAAFPRYPAAYLSVIGITANDAQQHVFNRAGQGEHVEFTLPGVDLRVAFEQSTTLMSGTSLATALATAMLASLPSTDVDQERQLLAQQAQDLGKAGRDPVFGYGLLRINGE